MAGVVGGSTCGVSVVSDAVVASTSLAGPVGTSAVMAGAIVV